MFICSFVCLKVIMICLFFVLIIIVHLQEVSLKVFWRTTLIWLRYLGSKNVYLIACLFVCFFLFFMDLFVFCFNHRGTHTKSSPENFVKIGLDLAEIIRILKMFICLFVFLFVYWFVCFFYFNHLGIPTGIYPQNFVKIRLGLAEIYRI